MTGESRSGQHPAGSLAEHFVEMARQNLWANARLYQACGQLTDTERRAPRTAFFGTIHRTLAHILLVDDYYVGTLVDGHAPRPEGDDAEDGRGDFATLAADQAASDRRLLVFCEGLTPARLADRIVLEGEGGGRLPERLAAVLPHLFLHQTHHRGQVHAMLSGTSVPPPQLDEYFLEQAAPLRAAELQRLGLPLR
jgi:uncharacterized damage-inducible protein DinB